jgi:hypothetical protein
MDLVASDPGWGPTAPGLHAAQLELGPTIIETNPNVGIGPILTLAPCGQHWGMGDIAYQWGQVHLATHHRQ